MAPLGRTLDENACLTPHFSLFSRRDGSKQYSKLSKLVQINTSNFSDYLATVLSGIGLSSKFQNLIILQVALISHILGRVIIAGLNPMWCSFPTPVVDNYEGNNSTRP